MRTIAISVGSDGTAKPVTTGARLGYCGEHMSTNMYIKFDTLAFTYFHEVDYFRVVVDGKYSEKLTMDSTNAINFTVPSDMLVPPAVHCQIVGYHEENGEPTIISKSSVFELSVGYSQMPHSHAKTTVDAYEAALVKCENFADKAKLSSDSAALSASLSSEGAESSIAAADAAETSAVQCEIYCNNSAGHSASAASSSVESAAYADAALKSYENALKISEGINQVSNSVLGTATGASVTVNDISPIVHEPSIVCSVPSAANDSFKLTAQDISYTPLTLPYPVNHVSATLVSRLNPGWENVGINYNSLIYPLIDGVPSKNGAFTFVLQREATSELECKISGTTLTLKAYNQFFENMEYSEQVSKGAMITGFIIKDAATGEDAVIPEGVTVIGKPESHMLTLDAKVTEDAFFGQVSVEPIMLPRPVSSAEVILDSKFDSYWAQLPIDCSNSKLIPIINGTVFNNAAIATGIDKDSGCLMNLSYSITDTTLTITGTKYPQTIEQTYQVDQGSMITGFVIDGMNTGEDYEPTDSYIPEGPPEIYTMTVIIDKGTLTLVTATALDGSIQMATADENGKVYGILSVYPEMTFSASEGDVTVTYNRDLNKCLSGAMPKNTVPYTSNITVPANQMIVIDTLLGDITVTLGDGLLGYDNEWDFTVTQGQTAYNVVLPLIEWIGDVPAFEANTVTQARLFYKGEVLMGVAI